MIDIPTQEELEEEDEEDQSKDITSVPTSLYRKTS